MPSLNSLISTARSSQSAGGERLYKSEAKKIAAHITRDSMVSAARPRHFEASWATETSPEVLKSSSKTLELEATATIVPVATPSSSRPAAQPIWQLLISVETIH